MGDFLCPAPPRQAQSQCQRAMLLVNIQASKTNPKAWSPNPTPTTEHQSTPRKPIENWQRKAEPKPPLARRTPETPRPPRPRPRAQPQEKPKTARQNANGTHHAGTATSATTLKVTEARTEMRRTRRKPRQNPENSYSPQTKRRTSPTTPAPKRAIRRKAHVAHHASPNLSAREGLHSPRKSEESEDPREKLQPSPKKRATQHRPRPPRSCGPGELGEIRARHPRPAASEKRGNVTKSPRGTCHRPPPSPFQPRRTEVGEFMEVQSTAIFSWVRCCNTNVYKDIL